MQINFHFSPKDEELLLKYIFERSGYFIYYNGSKPDYYEAFFSNLPNVVQGKYLSLLLFRLDYAPQEIPTSLNVLSKLKYRNRHENCELIPSSRVFKSEYIEFTRCVTKNGKLHWGRLWMNGLDDDAIKFYRNISSFIRKISKKTDRWEWVGNNVQSYITENNLELGQPFGSYFSE